MYLDDEASRRQQIVQDFKRRREREMLAFIPCLFAFWVFYEAWQDPGFRLAGLSGWPLLLAAGAAVALIIVHHLVNWRCPVCRQPFLTGPFGVKFCKKCGALFEEPKTYTPAERQEEAERAFQHAMGQYRGNWALHLFKALIIIGLGLLGMFALDEPAVPGSWLARNLGQRGAGFLFGGIILLVGLVWLAFVVRGFTVGARRYAEQMRRVLKI
jgi:ribosomal protein L37AE/L43A